MVYFNLCFWYYIRLLGFLASHTSFRKTSITVLPIAQQKFVFKPLKFSSQYGSGIQGLKICYHLANICSLLSLRLNSFQKGQMKHLWFFFPQPSNMLTKHCSQNILTVFYWYNCLFADCHLKRLWQQWVWNLVWNNGKSQVSIEFFLNSLPNLPNLSKNLLFLLNTSNWANSVLNIELRYSKMK